MILALTLLVTPVPDSLTRLFSLSARIGPAICLAGDGDLYDDFLGNIHVPFAGVKSALFLVDEGIGRHEPAALFEFDEADRLVHQVHYIFGDAVSDLTIAYEGSRLVSQTFRDRESPSEHVQVRAFSYDASGRLTSSRTTLDHVEQSKIDYRYSSDGQVVLVETEFLQGSHPKVTTTRIQSNLFGYVTREWRQEEGSPEMLVRRYEFDDRGRIATAAFVSDSTNELFAHEFTYSEVGPAWRTRSIKDPDGRLVSKTTTFLSASGRPLREESSDYPDDSGWAIPPDLHGTRVSVCEYDEQGCLVRFVRDATSTADAEGEWIRSIEKDASGTVVGWQDFRSSGSPRVTQPGRHVRIDLKCRTAPR